nr:unnamed protein product [Haemonchus contortus]
MGDPNRDQRSILSSERRFYSPPLRSENGAAKPNREAFLQLGHFEDYKYGTVHWNSYRVGRSKRGSNVGSVLIETGPILVWFRLLS